MTGETLTAVVVNRDNGLHPATIIVDRYNRIGYDNSISLHRCVMRATLSFKMQDYLTPPSSTLHSSTPKNIFTDVHLISERQYTEGNQ